MAESRNSDFAVIGEKGLKDWKGIGAGGFGQAFTAKASPLHWRLILANKLCLDDGYKQRQNVVGTYPADYATYSLFPPIIHPELKPGNTLLDTCVNVKTSFSPSVSTAHTTNEYRFKSPGAGLFHCRVTGLLFKTTGEGEVVYRTVQWEERWLQSTGGTPGGPLFDIKCPQKSVCQLHLPRCEVTLCDDPSVAHITDEERNLLKPLKVTQTHVIINVTHLSLFGIISQIKDMFFGPSPKQGQVLLLLRPPEGRRQILSVFLLPSDLPWQEVQVQHKEDLRIDMEGKCALSQNKLYSLLCHPHTTIQPEAALYHLHYGPNFHPTFEVWLDLHTEDVSLTLLGPDTKHVWKETFDLKGARSQQTTSLRSVRSEFVHLVPEPVLDGLLDILLNENVANDEEIDSIRAEKYRADKARLLIHMVTKKGKEASLKMIAALNELDPTLHHRLGLEEVHSTAVSRAAMSGGDSGKTRGRSGKVQQDADDDDLTDAEKAYFVTQNRADLIQKVSEVVTIVDSLGYMVHPELYFEIHAEKTSRNRMRRLYTTVLDPGGRAIKAAFYDALKQHQPFLLETLASGKHFVDIHRHILIEKVTIVEPILDLLVDEGVLTMEGYDNVRSKCTLHEKMRVLYTLLNSTRAKDIFYKCLEEHEKLLLSELM